jgi:rhamnosyltransferase
VVQPYNCLLPLVSVVVITKNQQAFLRRSLGQIAAQTGVGRVETVVVDSGSTDGAVEFVRSLSDVRLVQLPPEQFNYARAHNLGAQIAQGEIVVRLSGDAVPLGNDWLSCLVAPFAHSRVAATWGRQQMPRTVLNALERVYESVVRPRNVTAPVRYTHPVAPLGCNMAYRRVLWQTEPWNEALPQAEDFAWLRTWQHRGNVGVFVPTAIVEHGHNESLGRALRRSLAQTYLQTRICQGAYDNPPRPVPA